MKCQKCGADIPDGVLYCTKCGEEILIVPYFEPELETELDENLHRISDEAFGRQPEKRSGKNRRKKHYLRWVIVLVVISMFAGGIALGYLLNSPLYHLNRANMLMAQNEYKEAVYFYEKALLKGDIENPSEIYMYLIRCYEELGYDGKYEEYLLKIIANRDASESQLLTAYTKLINLYLEGKGYQTINNLLKNCKNDRIVALYQVYMVDPPIFSHSEGSYNEIIPLKIGSSAGHKIKYTINGDSPVEEGEEYKEPIFLENGIYEIRAVCINENQVVSDEIIMKYEVNFATK